MRTGVAAVAAADAFRTVGRPVNRDVKLAGLLTFSALCTFGFIDLKPVKCNRVEQSVNRTQGTEVPAERTVYQNGKQD